MRIALLLAFLLVFPSVSGKPKANSTRLDSGSCDFCTFIVGFLHDLWGDATLGDCVVDLVTFLCTNLKIEDHFVCQGITSSFKDEFIYVIGQIIIEPSELCGLFIQDCGTFVNPLNASWNLTIPGGKPPPSNPPPINYSGPTRKVLHLTDLHIDRYYQVGLEARCGEPQCCRPPEDPNEISRADDVQQPAGKWGTVASCDSPWWLFTNMVDHVAQAHTDLDYIVVSGDLESHADWDYTRESHQSMIRNVSDYIRKNFPTTPVIFAAGNHEAVPINNFAPHFVPEQFLPDWLYDTFAEAWRGWVPADQVDQVKWNGSFMRKLFPGLRLISLNNGLGDSENFFLYINQTDPDGTLTWFMNQLVDAEVAGDKVHVVAHAPGGNGEGLEGWAINYYRIVNRFEDTIVGQFFGHTHSEEYNVFYEDPEDAGSRPTAVTWSAPSLTPYSEYFPAYRVYTTEGDFQGTHHRIIDWAEYYVNLTEANASNDPPVWKVLYPSVLDEYGLEDCSPGEWSRLIDRMLDDTKLFERYRKNFYRRDDLGTCDYSCRRGFLCSARRSHHTDALCADLPAEEKRSRNKRSIPDEAAMRRLLDAFRARRGSARGRRTRLDACPLG